MARRGAGPVAGVLAGLVAGDARECDAKHLHGPGGGSGGVWGLLERVGLGRVARAVGRQRPSGPALTLCVAAVWSVTASLDKVRAGRGAWGARGLGRHHRTRGAVACADTHRNAPLYTCAHCRALLLAARTQPTISVLTYPFPHTCPVHHCSWGRTTARCGSTLLASGWPLVGRAARAGALCMRCMAQPCRRQPHWARARTNARSQVQRVPFTCCATRRAPSGCYTATSGCCCSSACARWPRWRCSWWVQLLDCSHCESQ